MANLNVILGNKMAESPKAESLSKEFFGKS